ncbi:uncharacterized protein B0P05DRAFT_592332 [Gilbertella persicaria]|uniref:uncharacterized protein n=1 Tax=Gilbertella persicaria TaxID=101096 RepID=UPI00221EF2E0|nr:uncharacterized protein B0P05DRAFT_592332 [Gilbertella persicaria]KAI8048353.1 hypothetical protein B0P05DRAFT_592332 [Gilbertella persicaria]
MDRLPAEILTFIVNQLTFREKITCITVCRRWYKAFQRCHLFEVLKCRYSFSQKLTKLQENNVAHQVTQLHLNTLSLDPGLVSTMMHVLPNMRSLTLTNHYSRYSTKYDCSILPKHTEYWSKIQSICEHASGFSVATALLQSVCLTHLTLLQVEYCRNMYKRLYMSNNNKEDQKMACLIHGLKNAPHLETLHLSNICFPFSLLEILHKNTPRLRTLCLNYRSKTLRPSDVDHKTDFILPYVSTFYPADSLEDLSISFEPTDPNFGNTHIIKSWLHYISQKYIHLRSIQFMTHLMAHWYVDELLTYEASLARTLKALSKLESCSIDIYPVSDSFAHALGTRIVDLNVFINTEIVQDQLYAINLSSRITSQVKRLTLTNQDPDHDPCYIYNQSIPPSIQQFPHLTCLHLANTEQSGPYDLRLLVLLLNAAPQLKQLSVGYGAVHLADLKPDWNLDMFCKPCALEDFVLEKWSLVRRATSDGYEIRSLFTDQSMIVSLKQFFHVLQRILDLSPHLARFVCHISTQGMSLPRVFAAENRSWIWDFKGLHRLKQISFRFPTCKYLHLICGDEEMWVRLLPLRHGLLFKQKNPNKTSLYVTFQLQHPMSINSVRFFQKLRLYYN